MSERGIIEVGKTKRCSVCKETKPLSEFHKARSRSDGHGYLCRPCRAEYYKRTIYPKLKASEKYQEYHREQQKLYSQRHPERPRAHAASRRIIAEPVCQQCGTTNGPLHKHHPDYSRPKHVVTLCVPCHERIHHANTD